MATHSSTLAWKIPWTEGLGGLHSPWSREELDTTKRLHRHHHYFPHPRHHGKIVFQETGLWCQKGSLCN